jgi:hypothetical protein
MSAALLPQQPDLRAFVVFNELPSGCIAHLVTDDRTLPVLRPGDTVVIDTADCEPTHRDLFVMDYGKGSERPRRVVVEMALRQHTNGTRSFNGWWSHPLYRPRSNEEAAEWAAAGRPMYFSDGPICSESASGMAYLRAAIVGRVIGILEPNFAEPMRQIGEVR